MRSKGKSDVKDANQIFLSLAPCSGEGYANSYADGLDFAFSEQSVCNIGIVGPYASGKTTVLKSYESTHDQQYVYITLGDYVRSSVQSTKEEVKPTGSQSGEEPKPGTEPKPPSTSAVASKAKREATADLQNRIIEQLLCYESPYGFWRSSISKF